MPATEHLPSAQEWSAAALRLLPPDQRDAVLADAAERAAIDYHHDHALTAFEAFGHGDLFDDSADTWL